MSLEQLYKEQVSVHHTSIACATIVVLFEVCLERHVVAFRLKHTTGGEEAPCFLGKPFGNLFGAVVDAKYL